MHKKGNCYGAASVREVLTINTVGKGVKKTVSHIDKSLLDVMFSYVPITMSKEYDEELKLWTLAIDQVDIYGEGPTEEAAADDLVKSTLEYVGFYYDKLVFYGGDTAEKKAAMAKLARCEGNSDTLRTILGF